MEQLQHIIIDAQQNKITFVSNRGTQRTLQFQIEEQFIQAISYCQYRILPNDIYYI